MTTRAKVICWTAVVFGYLAMSGFTSGSHVVRCEDRGLYSEMLCSYQGFWVGMAWPVTWPVRLGEYLYHDATGR